jgi:hypothetical protein
MIEDRSGEALFRMAILAVLLEAPLVSVGMTG